MISLKDFIATFYGEEGLGYKQMEPTNLQI